MIGTSRLSNFAKQQLSSYWSLQAGWLEVIHVVCMMPSAEVQLPMGNKEKHKESNREQYQPYLFSGLKCILGVKHQGIQVFGQQ